MRYLALVVAATALTLATGAPQQCIRLKVAVEGMQALLVPADVAATVADLSVDVQR